MFSANVLQFLFIQNILNFLENIQKEFEEGFKELRFDFCLDPIELGLKHPIDFGIFFHKYYFTQTKVYKL